MFCKSHGFEKMTIQCDPENAAIDMVHEMCKQIPNATPRTTPRASKGSSGLVERLHQHVQGMFRTYKSSVQRMYGIPILIEHPICPWMHETGAPRTRGTSRGSA